MLGLYFSDFTAFIDSSEVISDEYDSMIVSYVWSTCMHGRLETDDTKQIPLALMHESATIFTFKRVPNHQRLLIIDDKTFMSLPNKQRRSSTRLAKLKV